MITVAVFGNSHLGALAQAEAANKRFADAGYDLFYWGAAGGNFPRITYADGTLRSPYPSQARMISGGRCDALYLSEIDVLVVYGAHIGLSYQARRLANARAEGKDISSAFQAALEEEHLGTWWADTTAAQLMAPMRADFPSLPMLYYSQPMIAKHGGFYKDAALARSAQADLIVHMESWCADHDIAAQRQPEETIVDTLYTDPRFSRGSIKMGTDDAHPADDHRHMNADYGDAVLTRMLPILNTMLNRPNTGSAPQAEPPKQKRRRFWL